MNPYGNFRPEGKISSAIHQYRELEKERHQRARQPVTFSKDEKVGVAIYLAVMALLFIFLITLGIGPYIFSVLFGFTGLLVAAVLAAMAYAGVQNRKRTTEISDVTAALANECLGSLIELEMDVDEVAHTRGIGTNLEETLEEKPLAIKNLQRQIAGAIAVLKNASDPASQLEAVGRAELVKARVLEELG